MHGPENIISQQQQQQQQQQLNQLKMGLIN